MARGGLSEQCPNLARLFRNMTFTISAENHLMSAVLEGNTNRRRVAKQWIEDNPQMVASWLEGVRRYQGGPDQQGIRRIASKKCLINSTK